MNCRVFSTRPALPLLTIAVLLALPALAAAQGATPRAPLTGAANVIKAGPGISAAALAGRADSDLVELSDGRRLRLGDARRLAASISKARAAARPMPITTLRAQPATTGTPINNTADVNAALKRGDQETVVLPSGRRATVAQLRLAQSFAAKQGGRPSSAVLPRANLTGPAIKVTPQSDFKALMNQPDATVLESPKGTRVTVGEIKQHFAQQGRTPVRR